MRYFIALWWMVFVDFLIMLGVMRRLSSSSMLLVCVEQGLLVVIIMSGLTFQSLRFDCFSKGDVFVTFQFDGLVCIHVLCEFELYYL